MRSFALTVPVRRVAVLCLVVTVSLLGFGPGPLSNPADARPGGGQNYRAPSRSSPPRSSPTYRSSPSYRSSPVPVPVPVPIPSSRRSESYSSGSSSSDYSRPASSDGGNVMVGLIFLLVLVALGLLVVWLIVRRFVARGPARAAVRVDHGAQTRGIAALRAQDPGFDPAAFTERTRATMARVNEAWSRGSMGPARRLISDGVFVRFQTQIKLLQSAGLRNVMVDWRVLHAEVLAAEADPQWDTVHVKVVGEARDADVPAGLPPQQAEAQARSAQLQQYEEVWSFLRRRGKKSQGGVPALEGRCPSCGADLPLSDVVQCEHCKALVNSGEHDWVLAEITQPEEWSNRGAEADVPGMAGLRERDPTVSRQELEDRASVIFWKWVEAKGAGPQRLARFCLTPPSEASAEELQLWPARMAQVAVGSADVREVISDGSGLDTAVVEIRWSASIDGREPEGMVHLFILGRQGGAQSKRGLSSLDCPVCRGPLEESDALKCPYCGEQLTGGKHEWALQAVQPGAPPMAEEVEEE